MTRITINADLRDKLLNLTQPLELCDETGRVLAQVLPLTNGSALVEPALSEEELQRREQEEEDYSTADVLAHLENL